MSDLNLGLGVGVSPGEAALRSTPGPLTPPSSEGVPLAEKPLADVGVEVSEWKRGRKKT